MKDIPSNVLCPCGSGRKYKRCCKEKNIFKLDDNGHVVRRVELHPKAVEIVEKNKREFSELFGREPQPNEPVLFHTLLMSDDDYMEGIQEIFDKVGIPKEIAYAHRKTGMAVSEMNEHLIPTSDMLRWDAAIKEYRDIEKGKKKINRPEILDRIESLSERLNFCQYLLGLIIFKQNDIQRQKRFDENITEVEYILFCLTKNLKTLRAALNLIEGNFGEDALNLIRSIFENYLHVAMSIRNNDFINDIKIKIGLLLGTHKYIRKGAEKVVEVATGKEARLKFTKNHQLALLHPLYGKMDIEIYNYLYDFLSGFTHPDLVTLSCYVDENGFNYQKRNFSSESILYISFFNLLILNEIKNLNGIDNTSILDIDRFTQTTAPHLIKIFGQVEKDFPNYPSFMKERVEALYSV
ncbi:DUF5677 domain-containing protein [Dinghuibacter silviterrae]|uniref:SEC-C motif-containing protein n=1 Tax=Dinghuibacter silviterrae TaxID=1539049 RepID=A0A4R8DF37_9BACT|nr:DUF5677 domain-containing protein [Dinghuibacter silviterrae]TDW96189.1 SEC-C motif-containing protein [Dinghuibacter silviterrae]